MKKSSRQSWRQLAYVSSTSPDHWRQSLTTKVTRPTRNVTMTSEDLDPTKNQIPTKRFEQSFPKTNTTTTCARVMGQDYLFTRHSPGTNPTTYYDVPFLRKDSLHRLEDPDHVSRWSQGLEGGEVVVFSRQGDWRSPWVLDFRILTGDQSTLSDWGNVTC
jgi:hypothetical protein